MNLKTLWQSAPDHQIILENSHENSEKHYEKRVFLTTYFKAILCNPWSFKFNKLGYPVILVTGELPGKHQQNLFNSLRTEEGRSGALEKREQGRGKRIGKYSGRRQVVL
jgi:hypothetical protein